MAAAIRSSTTAQRNTFADANSPKYLVTLLDGDHDNGFAGGESERAGIIIPSTLDFLEFYLTGDDEGLDRLEQDADIPGVVTLQVES
jgi:hypothetical protein